MWSPLRSWKVQACEATVRGLGPTRALGQPAPGPTRLYGASLGNEAMVMVLGGRWVALESVPSKTDLGYEGPRGRHHIPCVGHWNWRD